MSFTWQEQYKEYSKEVRILCQTRVIHFEVGSEEVTNLFPKKFIKGATPGSCYTRCTFIKYMHIYGFAWMQWDTVTSIEKEIKLNMLLLLSRDFNIMDFHLVKWQHTVLQLKYTNLYLICSQNIAKNISVSFIFYVLLEDTYFKSQNILCMLNNTKQWFNK